MISAKYIITSVCVFFFHQKLMSVMMAHIAAVPTLNVPILIKTKTELVNLDMKEMDSTVLVRKLTLLCKSLVPKLSDCYWKAL